MPHSRYLSTPSPTKPAGIFAILLTRRSSLVYGHVTEDMKRDVADKAGGMPKRTV